MNKKKHKPIVTHHGIYTVTVFDEEAYQENIRQYYPEKQDSAAPVRSQRSPGPEHSQPMPLVKKKRSNNFSWDSSIKKHPALNTLIAEPAHQEHQGRNP